MPVSFGMRPFLPSVLPTVFFIFALIAEHCLDVVFHGFTGSEKGIVESLQAILLFIAALTGLRILWTRRRTTPHWVRVWLWVGIACCVYIFLEEISYGQHYFGWNTPESWGEINNQNETNLHNTSSWLDQKPRLVLELGVIIGGILLPLFPQLRSLAIVRPFAPILPHKALFITALFAEFPRLYERLIDLLHVPEAHMFVRTSEVQELYFYYFMLLYFIYFTAAQKEKT